MPANKKLPHHLFENIIILIKISHHSLSLSRSRSLSPSLSSHVIFSLILTFFLFSAVCLHCNYLEGNGSLMLYSTLACF